MAIREIMLLGEPELTPIISRRSYDDDEQNVGKCRQINNCDNRFIRQINSCDNRFIRQINCDNRFIFKYGKIIYGKHKNALLLSNISSSNISFSDYLAFQSC